MKVHGNLLAGALACALLLAGCASTSGLSPEASLNDANGLAAQRALSARTLSPSAWPRSDWWAAYNDPQLDTLIDEALVGLGPAVSLPIFDGGRLRGNLAGTDRDYDIAVEQYNALLADTLRDIVDQLTSFASVEAQHREQAQALADAQEAYDLAMLRYREGIGNYLPVLSAASPLLEQQSLEADLRARDLEISISLVRALGGGFTAPAGSLAAAG